MEDLFLKFPEVSQKVCVNLDDKNLVNCKKVSKVLKNTIDNQKHTWVRMIRHFACSREDVFPESWRPILTKSPTEILKHLGIQLKMSNEKQIMVGIKSRNIIVCNWTPLDLTAWTGNLSLFVTIYNTILGKNPNFIFEGTTAFQQAAYGGHYDVCKFILYNIESKVLDINPKQEDTGRTLLHYAAEVGHVEIVKLIMNNLDTGENPRDSWERTPLHDAAKCGQFEICKFIVENMDTKEYPRDAAGRTPLHYAAHIGNFEICQFFMNKFEDQNQISDINGMTALHTALIGQDSFDHQVWKLIVDNLSDKNPRDHVGSTPLHLLAESGCLEKFEYIFNQVAEKNPMDIYDVTPLIESITNGQMNICKFIVNAMENKNPLVHAGHDPDTLLHVSALHGQLEIHEYFMDLVEDKNPKNRFGNTPLHYAAIEGNSDIVKLILEKVDDKNPKNNVGSTPFDFALDADKKIILKIMYEVMISKNILLEEEASVLRVIDKKPVNEKKKGFLRSVKDFFQMK